MLIFSFCHGLGYLYPLMQVDLLEKPLAIFQVYTTVCQLLCAMVLYDLLWKRSDAILNLIHATTPELNGCSIKISILLFHAIPIFLNGIMLAEFWSYVNDPGN